MQQNNLLYINWSIHASCSLRGVACERRRVSGCRDFLSLFQAPRETREGEGEANEGGWGEKKRERRGACNHFLKHLMPVYQLPVYHLIGQF